MLNEQDPVVDFKLGLLREAMPASSAVVFGDMYIVEGGYTAKCAELGCRRVLLIDALETPRWLEQRLANRNLDFYKGDFSDPLFMNGIRERFDLAVAFDILLHQAPLLGTLHLLLEKTKETFVIAQPVLKERETPNTLVYLPGQPADSGLYPLGAPSGEYKAFDPLEVNQSHWLWGMTPSLIRAVLAGEGFEVSLERTAGDLGNPAWQWWGCVARRVRENPHHWSRQSPTPGLFDPSW